MLRDLAVVEDDGHAVRLGVETRHNLIVVEVAAVVAAARFLGVEDEKRGAVGDLFDHGGRQVFGVVHAHPVADGNCNAPLLCMNS